MIRVTAGTSAVATYPMCLFLLLIWSYFQLGAPEFCAPLS